MCVVNTGKLSRGLAGLWAGGVLLAASAGTCGDFLQRFAPTPEPTPCELVVDGELDLGCLVDRALD